jgi:hypothetical protein
MISVFETVNEYVIAAREAGSDDAPLPVLADMIEGAASELSLTSAMPPISDSHDICLVAAVDPVVLAAGELLAARTGRQLRKVTLETLDEALDAAVKEDVRSIALIAPGWDGTGRASSDWLRAIVHFARDRRGFGEVRSGLVTAPTPAALTRLIARTLSDASTLSTEGAARVTVASFIDDALTRLLPGRDEASAGLAVADRRHVASGCFESLTLGRHAAIVFRGHGRSYCALDGYLCGARSPAEDHRSNLKGCIAEMSCQAPSFAQIDPRNYLTPVMVLDCCGAANATAPNWDFGLPSLAFHALCGAAVAVIASDGVTMGGADELVDVLAALAHGERLSDGVALLNKQRCHASANTPFLLLGDPVLVGGEHRFPGLVQDAAVAETEGGRKVTIGGNACGLWRAELPALPRQASPMLSGAKTCGVAGARIMSSASGSTLWFLADKRGGEFTMANEPISAFPEEMTERALDLERHLAPMASAAAASLAPLRDGAEQVLAGARAFEQSRLRVGERLPGGVSGLVKSVERRWLTAQLTCLELLVGVFLPGGLWPYRLWTTQDFESRHTGENCPYCGKPAILERYYRSPPLGRRMQRECMGCDLISDVDTTGGRQLIASLQAPTTLVPGRGANIGVTIASSGERKRWGAAAITIDGTRHGTTTVPLVQTFSIAPGETVELSAEVCPSDAKGIAHRYRLKALLLVDGEWMLLSRPVEIYGRGS